MSSTVNHPYHIVDESPWPVYGALGGLFLTTGIVSWFHLRDITLFRVGLSILSLVVTQWWRDISREGSLQGHHSAVVELGLRWGILLFIVSELFFFLRFFWTFFHCSLAPRVELGGLWPPHGLTTFNHLQIPLLNTVVLVSSGIRVTWAHHALIEGNFSQVKLGLGVTVLLGIYFTFLQALEYVEASFSFADSAYGSTFFIATGFHGLHVLIGTAFLVVCYVRHVSFEFSPLHHFGFEAAAWYWHFVDVVWLFLYIVVYWWGGA